MRGFGAWALVVASGCGSGEIYLKTPWASDVSLVVLTANPDGSPNGPPQVVEPNAPIRLEVERGIELQIHVLEYPKDRRVGECGVVLGGDHLALGPPQRSWIAPANDYGNGDTPTFAEAPPSLRATFDLRYDTCTPASAECARFEPERVVLSQQVDSSVESMVAVSDSLLYYQLDPADGPTPVKFLRHQFGSLEPDQLVDTGPIRSSIKGLTFDGARIHGIALDRARFTMTSTGGLLSYQPFVEEYHDVAALPGLVIEFGPSGLHAIEGELPSLEESALRAVLIRPDRIAVLTSSAIYYFGGREWKNEADIRFYAEGWTGIGGDDDALVAVNTGGDVLVRNEATGAWEPRRPPYGFRKLYQPIGLGGGKFLISGQDGLLTLYSSGEYCSIEMNAVNNLRGAVLSPSGRFVFVSGAEVVGVANDNPMLFRIPIPGRN